MQSFLCSREPDQESIPAPTLGPDLPGELLSAVTGKASLSEVDTQRVTIAAGHYQELEDKLE